MNSAQNVRKSSTAGHPGMNLWNTLNECHIITRYYSKPKYMLRTQVKHCHFLSLAFYEPEYSQCKINENTLGKANSFSVLPKVPQSTRAVTAIKKTQQNIILQDDIYCSSFLPCLGHQLSGISGKPHIHTKALCW